MELSGNVSSDRQLPDAHVHTNTAASFSACQASHVPLRTRSLLISSTPCTPFQSSASQRLTKSPPPASIQCTKIEYSLVTQDKPTTEHVIQVITGHAGCRGL